MRALVKAALQGVGLLFLLWLQVSLPPTLPSCFKQRRMNSVYLFVYLSLDLYIRACTKLIGMHVN